MFEIGIKITIDAGPLATAIQAIAQALTNKTTQTVVPTVQPTPVSVPTPAQVTPVQITRNAQNVQNTSVLVPKQTQPVVQTKPKPKYSIEQLQVAGSSLLNTAKKNDLLDLLPKFGIKAVQELKPEQIDVFAEALRGLGAEI